MKILIVGGVAAGTKIAAKLKREQRDAEVRILTMGKDHLLRRLRPAVLRGRRDQDPGTSWW